MSVPSALVAALLAAAPASRAAVPPEMLALVERMERAAAAIRDSEYLLLVQERVRGELTPVQRIRIRHRPPHDICMHWEEGGFHAGRRILYREGWNDGEMRVDPGPFLPTLDLAPDSRLVRRDSRHTVLESGLPYAVSIVARDVRLAASRPDLDARFEDLGPRTIDGRPAHCWRSELPKAREPTFYATRVEICADAETALPLDLTVWDVEDGELRLVERFRFREVRLDVGLTDADFTPEGCGL